MPTIAYRNVMPVVSSGTYNGQDFSLADFRLKSINGSRFDRCNFSHADLTGAIFNGCVFENCTFTEARLDHVLFVNTRLRCNDLSQAHWFYTRLLGCAVVDTIFQHTVFEDVFFERVTLEYVKMSGCFLRRSLMVNASFHSATLIDTAVEGDNGLWDSVVLRDAMVKNLVFTHTSMRNVRVEGKSIVKGAVIGGGCHVEACSFGVTRTRKCDGCGKPTKTSDFYKAHICRQCASNKGYSNKNSTVVGKVTKYPAFSIEVEVEDVRVESEPDPVLLVKYGFLVCSDTSVQSEYKSPIYLDRKSFRHVLPVLQSIRHHIGDHCGTHIHIQMENKTRLRERYRAILGPLQDWCMEHAAETSQFWGRYFTSYAMAPGSPSIRYSWINVYSSGQPTVEFRLCKFTDEKQFMTMLTFCRSMIRYLDMQLEDYKTPGQNYEMGQTVLRLYKSAIKNAKGE